MQQVKGLDGAHSELRKRAEQILQQTPESINNIPGSDIQDLVHELQVHQIELEMQNEELRRAQMELEATRDKYFELYDFAPVGYFTVSQKGMILEANLTGAGMLGAERASLIGERFSKFIDRKDQDVYYFHRKKLLETKDAQTCELGFVRNDGPQCCVEMKSRAVLNDESSDIRMLVCISDITERKRVQEEKGRLNASLIEIQKMQAVGTLAGGIAHNFNNLLMAIQGYVSLMLFDIDAKHPHYELLTEINDQVKNGARLASQLLGYARKGRYYVQIIDFNDLVRKTAETFCAARREVSLRTKLVGSLSAIKADRSQIQQNLLNLFINAADAMPGGGTITLETANVTNEEMKAKIYDPKPGKYVQLKVSDTGKGMDEETMQRMFEPFFTTKDMASGTGLGLASVYGIVKGHGGHIDVESKPGHGTTFTMYLPATEEKVEETVEPSREITAGNGTILLVDDEERVLRVGRRLLERLGYTVIEAESGQDAVEIYRGKKTEIDLVILDIIMPQMGGGEVYDKMKEINRDVRVLLASGYDIDKDAKELLKRGCKAFIQKPFDLQELSQKMKGVLDKE